MIYFPDKSSFFFTLKVARRAREMGLWGQLRGKLQYLDTYADPGKKGLCRVVVRRDGDMDFDLTWQRMVEGGEYRTWIRGGLILHGARDHYGSGSYPAMAVTMEPTTGWEVHT